MEIREFTGRYNDRWRSLREARPKLVRLGGFLFAGASSAALDLALFNILLASGVSSSVANGSSTLGALVLNFLINLSVFSPMKRGTFQNLRAAKRFALIAFLSAAFVFAGFEVAVSLFALETAVQQSVLRVLLILIGSGVRFVAYGAWVFRSDSRRWTEMQAEE